MKGNNGKIVLMIILAIIIVLQLILGHIGIVLNNLSSLGVPLALIELFQPTKNLAGAYIAPTDFYSPVCTSMHVEHATRSALMGKHLGYSYDAYGKDDLQIQGIFYLVIWVFIITEIVLLVKYVKRSGDIKNVLFLIIIALCVNICAEIMLVAFGYVNAVLSYGIVFLLFVLISRRLMPQNQ